jgi:hypothetical protein
MSIVSPVKIKVWRFTAFRETELTRLSFSVLMMMQEQYLKKKILFREIIWQGRQHWTKNSFASACKRISFTQ